MMLQAVEKRFGSLRAPYAIEHLSDTSGAYAVQPYETSPWRSTWFLALRRWPNPEANGMSEAFVKTFKRDYVRINPLPDGQSALSEIAGWIEDYNEIHPHSALKMRSPREFTRAQTL